MFSFISQYFYSKYFLVIAAEKLKSMEIKCNVYLKWVEPVNLHFPIAHLHYHYIDSILIKNQLLKNWLGHNLPLQTHSRAAIDFNPVTPNLHKMVSHFSKSCIKCHKIYNVCLNILWTLGVIGFI